MSREDDPVETVIQALEDVADVYGFRQSYARIYGTLYFQTEPTTMDELVEGTGFAKSTVSDALNALEELHMVYSEKKEGHGKTKFYTAEEDLEEVMQKFMENQASREIEIMLEALEEAKEQADDDSSEYRKIENLQSFYQRSKKFLKVMMKVPRGKKFSKLTDKIRNTLGNN